jgi:hypothetical protein
MTSAADRLFDLLPVHVRARDEQTGGLLAALLGAVGEQLEVLERDIDELYASWFIETCPEWVIPYIADLVGVDDLPPDTGAGRRAYVANTIAYRRRKGTVGVLEQVAADVTGWPAVAVEFHRLLAASAHVNHVRTDRPATAGVRDAGRLDLTGSALDPLAHTADVRRIATGRGRYGIGNVGVFLFDDQVYEVTCDAGRSASAWTFHPAGWSTPLYAAPAPEQAIESLAAEPNLPVPLRPRRLREADPAPLSVTVDGVQLTRDRIGVCGLDTPAGLPGWQVMVDPVHGLLHPYFDGAPADPAAVSTTHCYGGTADVGAGTYDRTEVHEDALAADPYAGRAGVDAQAAVPVDAPTVVQALADAQAAWSADGSPAGGTYVVSVADSASYRGDLAVHVPEATRLVLVAADWPQQVPGPGEVLPPVPGVYSTQGLRPHVDGKVTVTGDAGASVVVDGLLVTGDIIVGAGSLGSLTLSQSTVAGNVRVGANPGVRTQVLRSVVLGAQDYAPVAASLRITDSAVGPVSGPGLTLHLDGTTVRGAVSARTLYATSSILDGPAIVEDRQTGCLRFCCVRPGARVPRRHRCAADGTVPQYRSLDPGSPHFLTLAPWCPPAIAQGGEDESEMGVHHHLHRPARVRAAQRLLAGFAPVGIEIGVASQVPPGGSRR